MTQRWGSIETAPKDGSFVLIGIVQDGVLQQAVRARWTRIPLAVPDHYVWGAPNGGVVAGNVWHPDLQIEIA